MNQFVEYLKFNYKNISHTTITKLLEKQQIGIDQLLQQEIFIKQYKQSSFKATQIMTYEKFQTLVQYLTVEGSPEDQKRSYLYPMLACQLISSDNESTIDYFFSNGPVIVQQSVYRKTSYSKEHQDSQEEDQLNSQSSYSSKQSLPDQDSENFSSKSSTSSYSRSRRSRRSSLESSVSSQKKQKHKKQKYRFISPLIDKLFGFFQGPLNYTLAGYICRVLNVFLKQKPIFVMQYFLQTPKISTILQHIESRSVGDFIANLLLYDIEDLIPQRKQAFNMLIQKLTKSSQIHIISNISPVIRQIIRKLSSTSKKQFEYGQKLEQQFFTLNNFKKLLEGSVNNDEQNVIRYCPRVFYQYCVQLLLKKQLKEDVSTYLASNLQKFYYTILNILCQIEDGERLGIGILSLLDIMFLFIQKNIVNSQNIVSEIPHFCQKLLNLFQKYPFNNILHNQLLKFFKYLISQPSTSNLQQKLLDNDLLQNFLIQHIKNAKQNNIYTYICYSGHLFEMCQKIVEFSHKNSKFISIILNQQFSGMYQKYIDHSNRSINQALGGYRRYQNNENISFSIQEILLKHSQFLKKEPKITYQLKQGQINTQFMNISNTKTQKFKKNIKSKKNFSVNFEEQQENSNQRYWQNHLNYNLDQLIDDL